jgi:8-oxo-dGTP pyrophosphatase MutT (NUDIX family)|tara:strand:+ start:739 stop:1137 length:399 start_codon:yes stop_codon:yes gene_type:complete
MANLQLGDTTTSAKAFFLKEGKVLLVKPTGSKDRYDIPGGKIKFGESKEQGVHRECLEEIGLKIKKAKYIGKDYTRDKIYFLVTDWSGEIVLQVEEIEKYRWVELERVQDYYLTKTAYNGFVDYLLLELGGK